MGFAVINDVFCFCMKFVVVVKNFDFLFVAWFEGGQALKSASFLSKIAGTVFACIFELLDVFISALAM